MVKVHLSLDVLKKITCFNRGEQAIVNCSFFPLVKQIAISTLVTRKFANIRIPTSIVRLSCSEQEKFHLFVDVVVASIDRGTDHFCCFTSGPQK